MDASPTAEALVLFCRARRGSAALFGGDLGSPMSPAAALQRTASGDSMPSPSDVISLGVSKARSSPGTQVGTADREQSLMEAVGSTQQGEVLALGCDCAGRGQGALLAGHSGGDQIRCTIIGKECTLNSILSPSDVICVGKACSSPGTQLGQTRFEKKPAMTASVRMSATSQTCGQCLARSGMQCCCGLCTHHLSAGLASTVNCDNVHVENCLVEVGKCSSSICSLQC